MNGPWNFNTCTSRKAQYPDIDPSSTPRLQPGSDAAQHNTGTRLVGSLLGNLEMCRMRENMLTIKAQEQFK